MNSHTCSTRCTGDLQMLGKLDSVAKKEVTLYDHSLESLSNVVDQKVSTGAESPERRFTVIDEPNPKVESQPSYGDQYMLLAQCIYGLGCTNCGMRYNLSNKAPQTARLRPASTSNGFSDLRLHTIQLPTALHHIGRNTRSRPATFVDITDQCYNKHHFSTFRLAL
jgi:hypothetical protein